MEYRFAQGWSLAGEIARLAVSKKQDPGHPWKQENLSNRWMPRPL
jgi:hypothetical protein